mmetsp:Transcript_67318/g.217349  ORF Transcript_67318/g.217349 Transcript_67318/m.217349 type:complete len:716 (-) Transcript_67318:100-2247(-)
MVRRQQPSFLLAADLQEPEARLGRRKRARLRQEEELQAEARPRVQRQWQEAERRRSQLPKQDAGPPPAESAVGCSLQGSDESATGKKKARRLAVLASKKAQQLQKKAAQAAHQHEIAAKALKTKAKSSEMSEAAAELLERCRGGSAKEQRLLAAVAERLAADPEKELELFDVFFELHRAGSDARTRQLALLSAVAVFKDLVPAYRIREPTEQEKAVQRSQQVLSLERHEFALLQAYRRLLPLLEAAMRREPCTFAAALAALVKAAADFNYRHRLIGSAVKHAGSSHASVRQTVAEALQEVLAADGRLEASREIVLAVGRLAQAAAAGAAQGLGHELLEVLLHLPVGRAEDAALRGGGLRAGADEASRGLAEASITQGPEQLHKAEAELLYEVFVVYLRILRQRHIHGRRLLSAVLAGLARWGQQVNLELLLEILGELRRAVQDAIGQADELVALQALNCALALLAGPSQALVTDASWLAEAMSGALTLALPSLHAAHSESAQWPPARCFSFEGSRLRASEAELSLAQETQSVPSLVLRCLEAALRCPQGYGRASDAALAALIEHLFTLAATADCHVSLALLREAAALLRKHHRLHSLLEADGGLFGLGGVTDRAVTVLWHLQPLAFALAPELARAGRAVPAAVPQRRALLAELFPGRDARAWLAAEFPRHLAGLAHSPAPRAQGPRSRGRTIAFMSEDEFKAACGCKLQAGGHRT